jgi:biotin transporter BioY
MYWQASSSEKQETAKSDKMLLENKHDTLHNMLFRQKNLLIDTFLILCSIAFIAVSANIRVPLWPVPITFQTLAVFITAFFFGSKKGFLTILAYLLAGMAGIGVFAGYSSGLQTFLGPTAGYLIGFVFMVLIVGLMIEKGYGRTRKSIFFVLIVGEVVLYICGLTGLWFYLGYPSLLTILTLGLFPFLIGDIIKAVIAISLFPYLWKGTEKLTQ